MTETFEQVPFVDVGLVDNPGAALRVLVVVGQLRLDARKPDF